MLLIWDGLPSHRSRRMTDWVASQRAWLTVERLPGYAPDLNPIENAWGNLKSQELANLCAHTIDEVADIAAGGLDRIGSDAALCFAEKKCVEAHVLRAGQVHVRADKPRSFSRDLLADTAFGERDG